VPGLAVWDGRWRRPARPSEADRGTASNPQHPRRARGQYDHPVAAKGETYDRLFDRPGTYPYFCRPHAETMQGTIEVTG
jgi:plastocyanin